MRKTYVATRTYEIVFTADADVDDLESVAEEALTEGIRDTSDGDGGSEYEEIGAVPEGWEDESIVYGTHEGDMTLREALNEEMAPKYHLNVKRFRDACAAQGIGNPFPSGVEKLH